MNLNKGWKRWKLNKVCQTQSLQSFGWRSGSGGGGGAGSLVGKSYNFSISETNTLNWSLTNSRVLIPVSPQGAGLIPFSQRPTQISFCRAKIWEVLLFRISRGLPFPRYTRKARYKQLVLFLRQTIHSTLGRLPLHKTILQQLLLTS